MRVRLVFGWRARPDGKRRFLSPMPEPVRAAVLAPGFRETNFVRVFDEGWSREVEAWGPEVLAATAPKLRRVAARVATRRARLDSLTHAIVAFTRAGDPCLAEADRDYFWRVFQVPLFEQVLDAEGRTVAAECDAHQGLHVLRADADWGSAEGLIENGRCACGRRGLRLAVVRPERVEHPRARVAAVGR